MRRRSQPWMVVLALTAAALGTGCGGGMTIGRLLAEPERYANREVTLKGKVTRSTSVLGTGGYELDDGTGLIWVVSKHGVPRRGARVKSTGRVKDMVDAGGIVNLPREVSGGLVLVENEHRAQ